MRYISFKPGSSDAILSVLDLAKAFPDFYVVIQFTGGRAGGHHSFEDQFEPLLKTYGQIRSLKNVILVVGGGLGDADSCWDFLSGKWSLEFGYPHMPCDGVLLGTRVVACKEAFTCDQAKDLIQDAAGVDAQKDWEKSYTDDAGGVITVASELGEPIHVVNNRGARCWRQFDNKFFTKNGAGATTPDEMVQALNAEKPWVIKMLNDDYQKPWFGKKLDGTRREAERLGLERKWIPCDIGEMTYEEVAIRLTELHWYPGDMPGKEKARWFDVSFRERVFDWLRRTEERFCKKTREAWMREPEQLEEQPKKFLAEFFNVFPEAARTVLAAADVDYFINSICGIPTRKPINFIPEISPMFKRYFKSDSLWYSEQGEAIPGYDADKSFIIGGPVAAKYIMKKDETIKEIMDGIKNGIIAHIQGSDKLEVPNLRELPSLDDATGVTSSAQRMQELLTETGATYTCKKQNLAEIALGETAPSSDKWIKLLTHTNHSQSLSGTGAPVAADGVWAGATWLNSVLTFPRIQRGDRRSLSFLPRILSAVAKGRVVLQASETDLLECSFFLPDNDAESIKLSYSPKTDEICMVCTFYAPTESKRGAFPLEFKFQYRPEFRGAPIHEILDGRNDRIKSFYRHLWLDEASDPEEKAKKEESNFRKVASMSAIPQVTSQGEMSVTAQKKQLANVAFQEVVQISSDQIRKFCTEVGQTFRQYVPMITSQVCLSTLPLWCAGRP
jgi:fatty acid synthase subunit beta